ncbi:MAG: LuxR C-terminal-related transcriptional regulator [Sandaracinaceae bacterium]
MTLRPAPKVAVLAEDALARDALVRSLRGEGIAVSALEDAELALVDARTISRRARARLALPYVALVDEGARPTEHLADGASGVLRREADPRSLAAAVIAVASGLLVVDGELGRRALPSGPSEGAEGEELTAREQEVLGLVAAGLSNRRIAARLAISEHTAKFHVNSILGKLGVASRTEAVVVAARRGLLWL